MPDFFIHLSIVRQERPSDVALEFDSLESAYLGVCADVLEMAKELLTQGKDPFTAYYTIWNASGQKLMTVPFTDVLSASEWRLAKARRRPFGGPRSSRVREDLALVSFRRMFGAVDAGCVLLDLDMRVIEMNAFGARHSHVDAEAIRGASILDIFDLNGEPKRRFERFWELSKAGAITELLDMPYLVLDEQGQTSEGWWNARTWPVFDDDKRLLGFVEWAEPRTTPTRGGATHVRISRSTA